MDQLSEMYFTNVKWNIDSLLKESPFQLDGDDSYDVYVFRRLIEAAMTLGFWNGYVALA